MIEPDDTAAACDRSGDNAIADMSYNVETLLENCGFASDNSARYTKHSTPIATVMKSPFEDMAGGKGVSIGSRTVSSPHFLRGAHYPIVKKLQLSQGKPIRKPWTLAKMPTCWYLRTCM